MTEAKKVEFDYSKLIGKIIEKCKSQKEFAKLMGINFTTLSNKLNNKSYFTMEEIYNACMILEIDTDKSKKSEISDYFFTVKVRK